MEDVYKLMYTCETLYGPDIMPRMWPYTTIEYHRYCVEQIKLEREQRGLANTLKNTAKGTINVVKNGFYNLKGLSEIIMGLNDRYE